MNQTDKLRRELAEIEAAIEAEKAKQATILANMRSQRENIMAAIRAGLSTCRRSGDNEDT